MTAVAEPKASTTDGTKDGRVRHYTRRLTENGVTPPRYSRVALCGAEVKDLVDQNGTICQDCVDAIRKVKPE